MEVQFRVYGLGYKIPPRQDPQSPETLPPFPGAPKRTATAALKDTSEGNLKGALDRYLYLNEPLNIPFTGIPLKGSIGIL